jgi:hypothetical protein
VSHYKPHIEGMLQDALMADGLGHQYGIPELHRAAERIWDRAFNAIELTHGAVERERAMYQVGYRTPVHFEASRKFLGGNTECTRELIYESDQSALDALRQILDRQNEEPPSYD